MRNIIFLFVFLTTNFFAQNVNFSGLWSLDESKSENTSNRSGRMLAIPLMLVTQDNSKIIITSYTKRDTLVITVSLDGKENINQHRFGEMRTYARWLDGGEKLRLESIITGERQGMVFEIESIETWSIKDNLLIIDSFRETPMGEMEGKYVYTKKE